MMGTPQQEPTFWLTQHAIDQMGARRISEQAVIRALTFGRSVWTRGARIFAIGHREIERYRGHVIGLESLEGVHVVTKSDGAVLTVYRNRDFRGLRRGKHPSRCRHARSW